MLEALGKTVMLMGPSGAGQATKATNQILCAGAIQVAAEAMAFAQAEGLPLERVIEILGKGAGASWYFVHRAPFMARGEYPAGFRVRLHDKDLRICREMAARHGATLPVDRDDARGLREAAGRRSRRGRHLDDLPAQGPAVRESRIRWLSDRPSTCPTSAARRACSR